MLNRKNMTASTLDETALDAYYTLTEGGANYGIGLALAATLNSFKKPEHLFSRPYRRGHDGCLSGCL